MQRLPSHPATHLLTLSNPPRAQAEPVLQLNEDCGTASPWLSFIALWLLFLVLVSRPRGQQPTVTRFWSLQPKGWSSHPLGLLRGVATHQRWCCS